MGRTIQLIRGTTAQNDNFTGPEGSLSYDTDNKCIRVHDGVTPGGGERIPALVDVQRPTADNNYTWYRLWSDKWVEQGGLATIPSSETPSSVTLPITMCDSNYIILYSNYNVNTGNASSAYVQDTTVCSITTTSFKFGRGFNGPKRWLVLGYTA